MRARCRSICSAVSKMYSPGAPARSNAVEPDHFYYDQALRLMERERGEQPLFLFVYTVANHFPWDAPYRADLTPGWRATNNGAEIDEYLRRQKMSAQDYSDFVARLQHKFPKEQFLIVRFGDHQPYISHQMIDPVTRTNKVLVRNHIATRFPDLPYVKRKGSFRFDVRGLAAKRFDTVHDFAVQARDVLPGAAGWLERNRRRLDNKYHASKFYLLAVVLPWIQLHRAREQVP